KVERPAVWSDTSPSTKIKEASPASSEPELPIARREKDSDSTARRNASSYFLFPKASCAPDSKSLAWAALDPGRGELAVVEIRKNSAPSPQICVPAFPSGERRAQKKR